MKVTVALGSEHHLVKSFENGELEHIAVRKDDKIIGVIENIQILGNELYGSVELDNADLLNVVNKPDGINFSVRELGSVNKRKYTAVSNNLIKLDLL